MRRLLLKVGFLRPNISPYSLPIGNWIEGGVLPKTLEENFPGKLALEYFLNYIDSSRLLLQENGELTGNKLDKFIKDVKRDLKALANSSNGFLKVNLYLSA